jgi:acyl-coenzyme A synthetase/AMP-(fatty) acid ligase
MTGLGDWVIEQGVTVYRSSVSGFRLLLDGLRGDERFPQLRFAMVTGEPAYPADVERHRRAFSPQCLFGTSLGTRETGDYAHFFAGPSTALPTGALPGGYAVEGLDVYLLDDDGRPVPEGGSGELAVRCDSVPVGYWERPDLTEAALRPDPAGGPGRIYRTGDLGRRRPAAVPPAAGATSGQDRGHRCVGDVEHALLVPGVKERRRRGAR